MACIVEPQELILEQAMLYVFYLFSSMEWVLYEVTFMFFEKSDFYKN